MSQAQAQQLPEAEQYAMEVRKQMEHAFKLFRTHPSAANWNKLQAQMLSYQEHFFAQRYGEIKPQQ